MKPLIIYSADQLDVGEPPPLEAMAYRFLAKGDSWFSLGSLNPAKNSNLLFEMAFEQFACAVTCAQPGDTLSRMVNMTSDPVFQQVLFGRRARYWDGLLVSCGGNDLIDALGAGGAGVPAHLRLLRLPEEWGPPSEGAGRYISEEGWTTFSNYLQSNLQHLLALRDAGPSKGRPVFLHGYACPTPRPSGAGLGQGPWLLPPIQRAGIAQPDWIEVAALLMGRLTRLLAACAADPARYPKLFFFDTSAIAITPAALGATGVSGDWVNEIHLTRRGYEKLAMPWAAFIEQTMRSGA